MDLTKEEYDRYFIYKDGDLIWRDDAPIHPCALGKVAGKKAGWNNKDCYHKVKINGKQISVHRIIHIMEIGPIPEDMQIDHVNRIRDDNRIENLRVCTNGQNQANACKRKTYASTSSKYKGIHWHAGTSKWKVQIMHENTYHYLGLFDNEKDAARAYDEVAESYKGQFAKTNKSLGLL